MNRLDALLAMREFSKEQVAEKTVCDRLGTKRLDLLFDVIQGKRAVSGYSRLDIEAYALKRLMPEVYDSLPDNEYPHSRGELYEYDPPKNGQNIIKHGIGFGEVVSYSRQFGTLMVPCSSDSDGERYVIFADLNLEREDHTLELPLPSIREMNYTISIAHHRNDRFRFVSSRLMSTKKKKYRDTMVQSFGEIYPDEAARNAFVDRCVEILEEHLMKKTPAGA